MVWPWDFVGAAFNARQVPWVFVCDRQLHSWRQQLLAYRYEPSSRRLQQPWPPVPPQISACYQEEFCWLGRFAGQRALSELQLLCHDSALPPQRLFFPWQLSTLLAKHWPLYAFSWHARDAQESGASFPNQPQPLIGSSFCDLHWVSISRVVLQELSKPVIFDVLLFLCWHPKLQAPWKLLGQESRFLSFQQGDHSYKDHIQAGMCSWCDHCSPADAVLQVGSSLRYSHEVRLDCKEAGNTHCGNGRRSNVCQSNATRQLSSSTCTSSRSIVCHAFRSLIDRHRKLSSGRLCSADSLFLRVLRRQAAAGSRSCHRSKVSHSHSTSKKRKYALRAQVVYPRNGHLAASDAHPWIDLDSLPPLVQVFQFKHAIYREKRAQFKFPGIGFLLYFVCSLGMTWRQMRSLRCSSGVEEAWEHSLRGRRGHSQAAHKLQSRAQSSSR